jgi:hypothetical protein
MKKKIVLFASISFLICSSILIFTFDSAKGGFGPTNRKLIRGTTHISCECQGTSCVGGGGLPECIAVNDNCNLASSQCSE